MNRKYVLKKSLDIEKLIKLRKSVGNKYYAIYYQLIEGEVKVAISVSKKLGNAVKRNYQKRVIREIVRVRLDLIAGIKILIVAKALSVTLSYIEKQDNIDYLLRKIRKETKQ